MVGWAVAKMALSKGNKMYAPMGRTATIIRNDNGYQLGAILSELSRIADALENLVEKIEPSK